MIGFKHRTSLNYKKFVREHLTNCFRQISLKTHVRRRNKISGSCMLCGYRQDLHIEVLQIPQATS
jgi:hypothetical protein